MKQTRLLTVLGTVVAGITLLLGSTQAAHAGSLCIQLTGGNNLLLIGKSPKVPGKGKCNGWVGFATFGSTISYPSVGMVCTSADGTSATFSITTSSSAGGMQTTVDLFTLPVPSLTGGSGFEGASTYVPDTGAQASITATKVACSPSVVPFP